MTPKVVILGAGGMLGATWRTQGPAWRSERGALRFLSRAECDVVSPEAVREALPPGVDIVINCAGWTDVDRAEADEAGAMRINAEGPAVVGARCREIGATLVHYSTDYVFDGRASAPYAVDHPRAPLGAYGRSKARGEETVQASGADHLIIRTSWLYAPHGKNFVRTIARLAREKPVLRVVSDQRGRPTSCASLVASTQRLLDAGARGVFHATDSGECAWFDFARAIAARVNPACHVEPCTTAEFPRPAPRPAYSVLDLSKTERLIGPIPDWRTSLDAVLAAMEQQERQPA